MSELRNCPVCNNLFSYFGTSSLCPGCTDTADKQFSMIRDYIYDHPGSKMIEVARATGVKEDVILRFLREGRLAARTEDIQE